jgi:hypothetical protein
MRATASVDAFSSEPVPPRIKIKSGAGPRIKSGAGFAGKRYQEETAMRGYGLTTAAALLALAAATTAANAVPAAAPGALRGAIDEQATIEAVHCVPGWVHWHRWGYGTGCYARRYYGPSYFYGGPSIYVGPRRVYRRW